MKVTKIYDIKSYKLRTCHGSVSYAVVRGYDFLTATLTWNVTLTYVCARKAVLQIFDFAATDCNVASHNGPKRTTGICKEKTYLIKICNLENEIQHTALSEKTCLLKYV